MSYKKIIGKTSISDRTSKVLTTWSLQSFNFYLKQKIQHHFKMRGTCLQLKRLRNKFLTICTTCLGMHPPFINFTYSIYYLYVHHLLIFPSRHSIFHSIIYVYIKTTSTYYMHIQWHILRGGQADPPFPGFGTQTIFLKVFSLFIKFWIL